MSSHSGSHVGGSCLNIPVPMVKTRIKRQSQIVCRCAKLLLRRKVHLVYPDFIGQIKAHVQASKSKYSAFKEHGTSKKQTNYLGTNNVIYYKM